jgi:hypothetical protein
MLMAAGPMHASIERLHQVARERHRHYEQKARDAGTTGRTQTALRMAAYYGDLAKHLAAAARVSEHQP